MRTPSRISATDVRSSDRAALRSGQAIIESVIAVLVVTLLLLGVFQLSHLLMSKVLADHAAARAARARAVGFNDFMCRKAARVAVIPVAGRLEWPDGGEYDEVARIPIYLSTADEALAAGLLRYERWPSVRVSAQSGSGVSPVVDARVGMTVWDHVPIGGEARIESHFPLYMTDGGL